MVNHQHLGYAIFQEEWSSQIQHIAELPLTTRAIKVGGIAVFPG
jgi:hypothetical protein